MLRLYDPGAGQATTVRPARRGELRIWVSGPASPGGAGSAGVLRCLIVADLIRRVGLRNRWLVGTWQSLPEDGGEAVTRAAGALNVHPAQPSQAPPDPLDIGIIAPGVARPGITQPGTGAPAPAWLHPADTDWAPAGWAPTDWADWAPTGRAPAEPGHAGPAAQADPLAFRLVLLGQHYRETAEAGPDALAAAGRELAGWRAQVAQWACSPSHAVPARYAAEIHEALDADLDTPAALATLRQLAADASIPDGAKFEAFAYLDQLLGLDLARDIGR